MLRKLTAVCAALCGAFAAPSLTQALPDRSRDAVLLARVCIKEAGWEITDDCTAIHAVIEKRSKLRNVSYATMIQLYSKKAPHRAYLEQLDRTAKKPLLWPDNIKWFVLYRDKWLAVLAHADAAVSGGIAAPCDPDHWGDSYGDRTRALSNGWTQIACGNSRNEFWQVRR